MSKLDELILSLCPTGVQYKNIKHIAQVGTGNSNGNEAEEEGMYPFFIRSQTIKTKNEWEYDEEAIIIPGEGGIGEIYHYVNGKYAIHQRVYRIHFLTDDVNVKFAFYYFRSCFKSFILKKAVSATVKSIRKPMIEDFSIPVPPLPVQSEIVRILDNFTELTVELTVELTTELIARKKQYEYYRDSLLTFGDEVEYKKIKDIYTRIKGTPITAGKMKEIESLDGDIRIFAGGKTVINAFEKDIPNANITRVPAVLVQSRGVINAIFYEEPFTFKNEMWAYTAENRTSVKYLYYVLKNSIQQFRDVASGMGSMPQISLKVTEEFVIPVPPLDEQQRVVDILDRFDTLCNDITTGLPAEIEVRRKQYEYYCDKLLTFQEKS